jgi:hypothetical protein
MRLDSNTWGSTPPTTTERDRRGGEYQRNRDTDSAHRDSPQPATVTGSLGDLVGLTGHADNILTIVKVPARTTRLRSRFMPGRSRGAIGPVR